MIIQRGLLNIFKQNMLASLCNVHCNYRLVIKHSTRIRMETNGPKVSRSYNKLYSY